MKNLFLTIFLFNLSLDCHAQQFFSNRSSRTTTTEVLARIPNSGPGDILNSVIITSCSTTLGSNFSIYDSSKVASGLIATLETSTASAFPPTSIARDCIHQYDFHLKISSAITYTTSSSTAAITILWKDEFTNP